MDELEKAPSLKDYFATLPDPRVRLNVLVQWEMEFSAFKISYSALPVRVHRGLGPRRRP